VSSPERGSRGEEFQFDPEAVLGAVEGAARQEPYGDGAEIGLPYPLRRSGPDMRIQITVVPSDAELGVTRRLSLRTQSPCAMCRGEGTLPGSGRTSCAACAGSGAGPEAEVPSVLGALTGPEPCPDCEGYGLVTPHPCPECGGDGRVAARRQVALQLPAGVGDRALVRLVGEGPAGYHRGPAGDLYVEVRVRASPWRRLRRWARDRRGLD
jgi:molecular chaperone DnaJ